MELKEAIETYNELKDNNVIKRYEEAFDVIIKEISKQPERKYWKSTETNDYYIELPYEKLVPTKGGVKYEHRSYNCVYCRKGENPDNIIGWGNFCLSLCNLTEEQLKDRVNKFLELKEEI